MSVSLRLTSLCSILCAIGAVLFPLRFPFFCFVSSPARNRSSCFENSRKRWLSGAFVRRLKNRQLKRSKKIRTGRFPATLFCRFKNSSHSFVHSGVRPNFLPARRMSGRKRVAHSADHLLPFLPSFPPTPSYPPPTPRCPSP